MRCVRAAIGVSLALLPIYSVGAQGIPPICYTLSRRSDLGARPPIDAGWQGPRLDSIAADLNPASPDTLALEALRRADSSGMSWSIALLAADPGRASQVTASAAAAWYSRYFGDAIPILYMLDNAGNPTYRSTALRAIRGRLSAAQQDVVLRYACEAGWLLSMLSNDTAYYRWSVASGGKVLRWPIFASATLRSAAPLLDGQRRDVVLGLLRTFAAP
jgi:hypothetical protein